MPWRNSTVLKCDVAEAVAGLKAQPGKDFLVMGSGVLVQTLMKHNLVDLDAFFVFERRELPVAHRLRGAAIEIARGPRGHVYGRRLPDGVGELVRRRDPAERIADRNRFLVGDGEAQQSPADARARHLKIVGPSRCRSTES